jgi:type II secretory pathway predicted ATPase ExeA
MKKTNKEISAVNETMEVVMRDFLDFWNFDKMPFPKIISPDNAYEDVRINSKLKRLNQVLVTGEIGIVAGEVGMGKSTLMDIFLNQVSISKYRIIHIPIPQAKPRELYRTIAEGMGIDTSLMGADSMKVSNWLIHSYMESNRPNLILIDEAHILTPQSLNELRLLTNASVKHQPIVTLVLFGQPLLCSILKSPALIPFVQRVGIWLSMEGLDIEQTGKYIDWQLNQAGFKEEEIFPELTKKAIHRKTQGIPRIINRICLECLHEAAIKGIKVIAEDLFVQICKNLAPNLANT